MPSGKPRPLTAIQLKAARLLVHGVTGAATARELGIRPETVSRWYRQAEFLAELRRLVDLASEGDARARVEALTHPALDVLQAILTDRQRARAADHLQVTAAAAVLTFAAAILCNGEGGPSKRDR